MARKPKILKYTTEEIAREMSRFRMSATGEILFNLWAREREKLLSRGKSGHKAEDWYALEGFDKAISIIDFWADTRIQKEQKPLQED